MILPPRLRLSVPEAFFLRALLRAERWLPPDTSWQHKVGRYELDAAIPSLAADIEVDGWRHSTRNGRAHDEVRTAALESAGWRTFRFTARDVCDSVTLPVGDTRYYPGWKADRCVWALLTVLGLPAPEPDELPAPVRIPEILMGNKPTTRERNEPPFHADSWPPLW